MPCELILTPRVPAGVTLSFARFSEDRLEGFSIEGQYADPDGTMHVRLLPNPTAERYRIKPFLADVMRARAGASEDGPLLVGPLVFEADPPSAAPADALAPGFAPQAVGLGWRGVLRIALWCVLAALLLAGLFVLGFFWHRHRKLRRMTPRARAFWELEQLLRRALPSKGRFKDFYVELTMVVRRYIERRYAIRAPRQTTEEFLEAARNNRDFSVETLDGLRAFLAAADLVKFAGAEATPELADEAAGKARAYLEAERTAETPTAADGSARAHRKERRA